MDLGEEEELKVLTGCSCRFCQQDTPGSSGDDLSTCRSCRNILEGAICSLCLEKLSAPKGEPQVCPDCDVA